MIGFPNAKINLGLRIIKKRSDGYHQIQSLFIPVGLCDIMEFVESDEDSFEISGLSVSGNTDNNLALKALRLIRKYHDIPPLKIQLHKNIPMGAGLGGGSSDAAFMIKMLNEHFLLGLDEKKMSDHAKKLGSDCPFFIKNKPAMVTGTGTELKDYKLDTGNMKIALIDPGFEISTAKAYNSIKSFNTGPDLDDIIKTDIKTWKNKLFNDFEINLFPEYPELGDIKNELYSKGAIYASMTGSGSVLFGIFDSIKNLGQLQNKLIYFDSITS